MRQRVLLISVLAVAGLVLLVAISAVTVFALTSDRPAQAETIQAAPVQADTVTQPVARPLYEKTDYAAQEGGCNHSSKMQMMTEKPAEKVEAEALTQAGQ